MSKANILFHVACMGSLGPGAGHLRGWEWTPFVYKLGPGGIGGTEDESRP